MQLTDDRFALVTSVNPSRPLKPRVLVHDPKIAREALLDPEPEDTPDVGIRRSLKPEVSASGCAGLPQPALTRRVFL